MADSADLVVLGGWYGTGQKGGLISVFLMGCQDTRTGNIYAESGIFQIPEQVTFMQKVGYSIVTSQWKKIIG